MTAPESVAPSPSESPSQPQTVADAGEHRVIELVRSLVPPPPSWVQLGIGDDAAVIEPERNRLEVVTTDVLIEGVHFDRAFCDPASIGHKALAVNLSDLAAMGAAPRAALLSLGLPGSLPFADLEVMLRALVELATLHKVTLIGGNVARSPGPLFLDVTLMGTVKRRRVLTRRGGRVGDALYVTGSLGAAAAGLAWLRRKADPVWSRRRDLGRRQGGRGAVSQAAASDAVRPDCRPDAGRHGLHGPERRPGGRRPAARRGQRNRRGRSRPRPCPFTLEQPKYSLASQNSQVRHPRSSRPEGGAVRRRGLRAASGRFTSVAATFFGGSAAERRAGDPHRDADGGRRTGAAAGRRRRAAACGLRALRVAARGENPETRGESSSKVMRERASRLPGRPASVALRGAGRVRGSAAMAELDRVSLCLAGILFALLTVPGRRAN